MKNSLQILLQGKTLQISKNVTKWNAGDSIGKQKHVHLQLLNPFSKFKK